MKVEDFDMFSTLLKQRSGLVLSRDKAYLLESRLMPVARKWNMKGLDELAVAIRTRREEALLRTLGLSGGQSLWLTVVEHAPSVFLAVLPGLALGIGIAYLLAPGMGLSAFAGGGTLGLRIDWLVVGLVSLALAAVVALAIGIGSWAARRARAADALRFGDD